MKGHYNLAIGNIQLCANLKPLKDCKHGPASQYWPWYKLVGFLYCPKLLVVEPSTGRRLWIYIRRIGGIHFDLFVDRRAS